MTYDRFKELSEKGEMLGTIPEKGSDRVERIQSLRGGGVIIQPLTGWDEDIAKRVEESKGLNGIPPDDKKAMRISIVLAVVTIIVVGIIVFKRKHKK